MRKIRKKQQSDTLGFPNLTPEQIGQFILRMQAVRECEEKFARLIGDAEAADEAAPDELLGHEHTRPD